MPRNATRRGGHTDSPRRGAFKFQASQNQQRNLLLGIENSTGFTLADEARSTIHGGSAWSQDSRLRSRPVSFVSAGAVDPLKQLEEQLQRRAQEALGHLSGGVPSANDDKNDIAEAVDAQANNGRIAAEAATSLTAEAKSVTTAPVGHMSTDKPGSPSESGETAVNEQPLSIPQPGTSAANLQALDPTNPKPTEAADEADVCPASPLFFFDTVRDTSRPQRGEAPTETKTEQPAVSDSESSEDVILFKGRNQMRNRTQNKPQLQQGAKQAAFDLREIRAEIQLVDETTFSDPSHKEAQSSLNKLPSTPRTLTRAQKKREKNEKKKNKKNRKAGRGGQVSALVQNMSEIDDEEALVADYIANMKQQDDGIEASACHNQRDLGGLDMAVDLSGELAPEPDAADSEASEHESLNELNPSLDSPREPRGPGYDVSSSRGFDVDNYDFMDWSGPVTSRSRKSKGLPPNLNLSDSDLEAQMLATFESSRLKKAEKRKERDMLRAKGLLGSSLKPDDLRAKYQNGMNLEEIANELKTFLLGNQTSLTLPPMDNQARKVIHELANKFNIKSKSTGAGDQRRPTLYRTVRTFKYTEEVFEAAIARVGRKYFPRRDRASIAGAQRQPRGQGGGSAALSYRDGEIVGGSAPELGEGNKGRLMLEKMGWSTGTALGATTNKGILTPVEQKVKRGKAGLG